MKKYIPLLFSLPILLISSGIVFIILQTPHAGLAALINPLLSITFSGFAYIIFSSLETTYDKEANSKLLTPSTWSRQFIIFIASIIITQAIAYYLPQLF